ncbi:unnamed protein product, partial [Amoebophrya sp. A120]|eukprot:GSA120T00000405001.1
MPLIKDPDDTSFLQGGFHLLEHQEKALHWLVQREKQFPKMEQFDRIRKGEIPLWTISKDGKFQNTATLARFTTIPKIPRGGFLSDEMGLGKTISLLACIAHDLKFGHTKENYSD